MKESYCPQKRIKMSEEKSVSEKRKDGRKKRWNKYILVALLGIMICFAGTIKTEAGFGDFNDYDSGGSDWGSDSWDSGSSWDDDYYYSGGSGSVSVPPGSILLLLFFVFVFPRILAAIRKKSGNTATGRTGTQNTRTERILPDRTDEISRIIKERDPLFTAPDFLSFTKQVYVDIQDAWCKRNLEPVRGVLHQNLYQQTERQIQKKIADGIVNHLERISVNTAYLTSYRKDAEYEYLTIYLAASMVDYQIKEATGQVILGDKSTRWNLKYKMKFMRSVSSKTRESGKVERGINCPNCGAPLTGTSFGKCEYCDSIVTTGTYNWVLSDFGVVKNDTVDEGIVS